VLNNEHKDVPL